MPTRVQSSARAKGPARKTSGGPNKRLDFWRGARVSFDEARVFATEDADLPQAIRAAVKRHPPETTAVDLFCGAGGLSLGLEAAGFNVVLAVDSDPDSCETHAHEFTGITLCADLADPRDILEAISAGKVPSVALIAGGPPCQPFSRAAKPKIRSLGPWRDTRPHLWNSFTAFVDVLHPDKVLLENVPDLVLWKDGGVLRQICDALEQRGYFVSARVLECWSYGVPQHRQRLFVVGSRRGRFDWPVSDSTWPTTWEAIGDLPKVGPAQREYWLPLTSQPDSELQRRLRTAGVTLVSDHLTREVRADDAIAFRMLAEGDPYKDLPRELRRYRVDSFDDKYNILKRDERSRSITAHIAKDGYWYIHPEGTRTISIREAARLQTFPDAFRFAGFPSARLKQIGNAVPPEVARRLGEALLKIPINRSRPFVAREFRNRLLRWHRKLEIEFPWRKEQHPWLTLATETLLRRTRAQAVATVWSRFSRRYRTPASVLKDPKGLRELLYPLGLQWRTENLIAIARDLVKRFNGRVPMSREELLSLPGVGDYVADAVRVMAFDKRAVLVDSNTTRIASRVFGLPEKWSSLRNLDLRASVARLGGATPPGAAVNLALIDLGREICLPRNPKCTACPVVRWCQTGQPRASSKDSS